MLLVGSENCHGVMRFWVEIGTLLMHYYLLLQTASLLVQVRIGGIGAVRLMVSIAQASHTGTLGAKVRLPLRHQFTLNFLSRDFENSGHQGKRLPVLGSCYVVGWQREKISSGEE